MLSYDGITHSVRNFLCVPKHFFVPKFIEMRRPLSATAKRAGWVGCNILLGHIPESGKVYFIRDGIQQAHNSVLDKWNQTLFLRQEQKLSSKGWAIDVLSVIERNGKSEFTLADIYKYESELADLHPENHHIKDKIRQQLQLLRDKNYLTFINRGAYRLINHSI